jgi:hypothetical protein
MTQIFTVPNPPVVIAVLPKGSCAVPCPVDRVRAAGFNRLHQLGQAALLKLDQPMKVVRHDDPGYGTPPFLLMGTPEFGYQQATQMKVGKEWLAIVDDGCDQISPAGLAESTGSQAMGLRACRHSIAFLVAPDELTLAA